MGQNTALAEENSVSLVEVREEDREKYEPAKNGLQIYLNEMSQYSVLTREEETEQAKDFNAKFEVLKISFLNLSIASRLMYDQMDYNSLMYESNKSKDRKKNQRIFEKVYATIEEIVESRRRYSKSKVQIISSIPFKKVFIRRLCQQVLEYNYKDYKAMCNGHSEYSSTFYAIRKKIKDEVELYFIERSNFVNANLRLVVKIANRYNPWKIDKEDLIQEGNLGLMKAVESFDFSKGNKLSTYATWWIHQSIQRYICDQGRTIRNPVHVNDARRKIDNAENKLRKRFKRDPSIEEIARECEIDPEKVEEAILMSDTISLSTPIGYEGEVEIEDQVGSGTSTPFDDVVNTLTGEFCEELLRTLTPREEIILRMRNGIGYKRDYTLEEVGEEFKVSRERIRQIEKRGMEKLQSRFKKDIEVFLS